MNQKIIAWRGGCKKSRIIYGTEHKKKGRAKKREEHIRICIHLYKWAGEVFYKYKPCKTKKRGEEEKTNEERQRINPSQ